jgi:outer membrane protein assembly factor BamB
MWMVYALHGNQDSVFTLDPITGEVLGSVTLEIVIRGVAADADGTIFGASFGGHLFTFDAEGDLATILETGAGALADIDIASDGTIAAGGAPNNVVLSDTSLAAVTLSFGIATGSTVFVDIREPSP